MAARGSAVNAVANAILTALNVASIRAVCPAGAYRNRPAAQTPPYLSIGRCIERPWDTFGKYGSQVETQIRVETSGAESGGDGRAATILSHVLALLDDTTDLTLSGWTVHQMRWDETVMDTVAYPDGQVNYEGTVTLTVFVRAT